jgi:hypothetical protein
MATLLASCAFLDPRTQPTGSEDQFPRNLPDPVVGVQYSFAVYTHCGLDSAQIDGEVWLFEGVPTGGAPRGFDDAVDVGSIVLTDEDHAIYTSSHGRSVGLTRGGAPRIQGCM